MFFTFFVVAHFHPAFAVQHAIGVRMMLSVSVGMGICIHRSVHTGFFAAHRARCSRRMDFCCRPRLRCTIGVRPAASLGHSRSPHQKAESDH